MVSRVLAVVMNITRLRSHRHLQEVIPEGVVLFAVQHLQQSRRRVAPHIAGQLVDLVQHQQGIHGAAADHRVDDPAGHGADVGFPVSPDVRLVPDTAQTQPGQFPVHGLGHGQGDGGFAYARGPTRQRILPLAWGFSCRTAMNSRIRSFTLSRP